MRVPTNALAIKALDDAAGAECSTRPSPAKRRKLVPKRKESVNPEAHLDREEAYHFTGYVPFRGEVWEPDGLKLNLLGLGNRLRGMTRDGGPRALQR